MLYNTLQVVKKQQHKVVPLAPNNAQHSQPEQPLGFAQMLQFISTTNHQHLWKAAYNQYSASRHKNDIQPLHEFPPSSATSTSLAPYETVLRECIVRMFGCPLLQLTNTDADIAPRSTNDPESHPNVYGVHAAIETSQHFFLVHSDYIETTLLDCITYSPAILTGSHNKPMFLIYQLLRLVRSLHDRGLHLGNVHLNDIFLSENLWLKVKPTLEANLLQPDAGTRCEPVMPLTYNTPREQHSIKDYCEMWCHGQLSNFDYLTILNNLSGRRSGIPGSHHIMPWVSDFINRSGANWRDLKKSKYRLNKGDDQLDQMFSAATPNDVPHHVSDIQSEITFFVYMARRTPKAVLCKHVRPIWVPAEYPASIQRLQQWTPDECIPEFFTEPAVFKSVHEDLPDLEVPAWASCPEDFVAKHREALESQHVSERLHHWIDLNFGYKLTGAAAIKAKNVCLSLVNDHKTLGDRGVVQLFVCAHPPRRYASAWTAKEPPRIYSQHEARRRLTRSTDDLSVNDSSSPQKSSAPASTPKPSPRVFQSPSSSSGRSPAAQHRAKRDTSMERSTSYHINVQKYQHQILLPKDYNPVAALTAVENMENFLCQTFQRPSPTELPRADWFGESTECCSTNTIVENSFTNRLFSETYEDLFMHKNSKRFINTQQKNDILRRTNHLPNVKHLLAESRKRDLQVLGCIAVELFVPDRLRPLGALSRRLDFDERLSVCLKVLEQYVDEFPRCVRYPIRLLLHTDDAPVSERGLPTATAQLFLQPLLSNTLFPFPLHYAKLYTLIASLVAFEETARLLNHKTFVECDGTDCSAFAPLEKIRVTFHRKIAECKVLACAGQVERLLEPLGHEQFDPVELVLPHIVDLLRNDETSTLTAWNLFDSVAIAIGPKDTLEHLLQPILRLYDAEAAIERADLLNLNFNSSVKQSAGSSFRSRKTGKLYHHSFLLRLIVRFGLANFLDNFVTPLIEAVGGCKEPDDMVAPFHLHQKSEEPIMPKSLSTRNLEYDDEGSFELTNAEQVASGGHSVDTEEEIFTFDNDDAMAKASIDDEYESSSAAILKIIDQLDPPLEGSVLDLRLNHSTAEEVTETTPLVECRDGWTNTPTGATSPTIAIPSFGRSIALSTIDCEIGSRKSVDSSEFLGTAAFGSSSVQSSGVAPVSKVEVEIRRMSNESRRGARSSTSTAETAAESLIWLSHRLGPLLTARHLTRNLLKMLMLCYVGQENLLPLDGGVATSMENLATFSVAEGRVMGDENAANVLECLTAISGELTIFLKLIMITAITDSYSISFFHSSLRRPVRVAAVSAARRRNDFTLQETHNAQPGGWPHQFAASTQVPRALPQRRHHHGPAAQLFPCHYYSSGHSFASLLPFPDAQRLLGAFGVGAKIPRRPLCARHSHRFRDDQGASVRAGVAAILLDFRQGLRRWRRPRNKCQVRRKSMHVVGRFQLLA